MRVSIVYPANLSGPGGLRAASLAAALASAGADVRLRHWHGGTVAPEILALAGGSELLPLPLSPPVLAGGRQIDRAGKLRRRLRYYRRTFRGADWFGDALAADAPELLLVCEPTPALLHQARRAVATSESVIVDVVDWHDPQWAWRRSRLQTVARWWNYRFAVPRQSRAVVISSYLAGVLGSHGVETLRVPPLFDPGIRALARNPVPLDSDALNVVVQGSATVLDTPCLRNTLNAAAAINGSAGREPGERRVHVHVAGHSPEAVRRIVGLAPTALDSATLHGWLPSAGLWGLVSAADFLVQQRPADQRWVKAGFPSKVTEAWTLGTPTITNLTSDVGEYARDGFNSLVLEDDSYGAMVAGLARARNAWGNFDSAAIAEWAAQEFSPSAHGRRLAEFLTPVA